MLRNRRIGCSVTGIAQFLGARGIEDLRVWMDAGYRGIKKWDEIYSDWLCIPKSIKMTSVKPSGTVSLLAAATPGVHFPLSRYYIRRVRMAKNSPLTASLSRRGYKTEPCFGSEEDTIVVEIPIDIGDVRTLDNVSMWEQLEVAAFMQQYYCDNQVSCTVTFDPKTEGPHIAQALNTYQYRLKGISFLPQWEGGAFKQMPYEKISAEDFDTISKEIIERCVETKDDTQNDAPMTQGVDDMPDGVMFCETDRCLASIMK
jgi:hypothetical protein